METGQASPEVFLNLGLVLWQRGAKEESLRILEQGGTRYPESAELAYRRGRILQQLGRHGAAKAAFQRALELAPTHPGATAAMQGR